MDLRILKHTIFYIMEEDPSEIVNNKYEIYNADCLEHMKLMADDSVDLIFCDLPYAQTDCHWDTAIDMDLFWKQVMRVKKLHTPIFMTTTTKFGVSLIKSAPKKCPFRYDIVWHKSKKVGFLSARKMPLRSHEMIYVFYERLPFYDLSSHTHKFIKKKTSINNININGSNTTDCYGMDKKSYKTREERIYDPPLPDSIVSDGSVKLESGTIYGSVKTPDYVAENITRNEIRRKNRKDGKSESAYDPPLPDSIVTHNTIYGDMPQTEQYAESVGRDPKNCHKTQYDPPLPDSIVKESGVYAERCRKNAPPNSKYDPPLPDSIIQAEYKNTTYGDIKMVDFKARKKGESRYDPPLPDSVLKEPAHKIVDKNNEIIKKQLQDVNYSKTYKSDCLMGKDFKDFRGGVKVYEPPLPDSVIKSDCYESNKTDDSLRKGFRDKRYNPPLPDSIVKETKCEQYGCERVFYVDENGNKIKEGQSGKNQNKYDPPLPVSIVKEPEEEEPVKPKSKASGHPVGYVETGYIVKVNKGGRNYWTKNKEIKQNIKAQIYVPPPLREPPKDVYNFKNRLESGELQVSHNSYDPQLPDSMLYVKSESGKHSTQKPVALMSWVLKYYSKEGDVVFDPTMGSGSTGVACANMNRKFIGCEMDKKIFKDAINRLVV